MNTARIVVLTFAVGAGGVATSPTSGSDDKPLATKPVAHLRSVGVGGRSQMPAGALKNGPLRLTLAPRSTSPKGGLA